MYFRSGGGGISTNREKQMAVTLGGFQELSNLLAHLQSREHKGKKGVVGNNSYEL